MKVDKHQKRWTLKDRQKIKGKMCENVEICHLTDLLTFLF